MSKIHETRMKLHADWKRPPRLEFSEAAGSGGVLGGSKATALVPDPTPVFFGLDWFMLNVG